MATNIVMSVERQGYKVAEVVYILGIGKTKAYELIRIGAIRSVRFGSRTIVPRTEIQRLLNANGIEVDGRTNSSDQHNEIGRAAWP